MKRKVLIAAAMVTLVTQSAMAAEATHKHIWTDDVKNSNDVINRYVCRCGATKDEVIAEIRNPVVTFDANGGYVSVTEKETYKGKIRRLPIPKHSSDYQWEGWYTEPIGGVLVDEKSVYEQDTTIYAHWTLKGTRTLTFACDGGTYIRPITKTVGTSISLNEYVPEKQGYIFKGWFTDPRTKENCVTDFTFSENDVLYAKWEADPTKTQPNTLLTTDPAYLTDEESEERIAIIKQMAEKIRKILNEYKR